MTLELFLDLLPYLVIGTGIGTVAGLIIAAPILWFFMR